MPVDSQSTVQFEASFGQAPVAILVHQAGVIRYLNPPCLALLGAADASQIVGKPMMQFVHPGLHSIVEQRIRRLNECREAAPPMEQVMVRLDGDPIEVEVSAWALAKEAGAPIAVLYTNVTVRRRAEREMRESQERF